MNNLLKNALKIGLLLEAVVLLLSYLEAIDVTTFFQSAARLSGRVSLLLFAFVVYHISIHWQKNELNDDERSTRLSLARAFAIVHIIHWFLLAVAVYRSDFELEIPRVIAGTIAYFTVIIYPYLLHKNLKMSVLSVRFERFYLYYLSFIFVMTYVSRLKTPTDYSGSALGYQSAALAMMAVLIGHFYLIFGKK